MRRKFGDYELDDSLERVNFEKVQSLLADTYWSPGVELEKVERAAAGSSLVVAAYYEGDLVGYLRVVSDKATFAWISDVIVDPQHRGKGLATALTQFALDDPDHQGLRRWVLATRDAHRVYEKCGFGLVTNPERWMIYHPPGSIGPV
jgi:GNAT superfamily N-acetyltransferase